MLRAVGPVVIPPDPVLPPPLAPVAPKLLDAFGVNVQASPQQIAAAAIHLSGSPGISGIAVGFIRSSQGYSRDLGSALFPRVIGPYEAELIPILLLTMMSLAMWPKVRPGGDNVAPERRQLFGAEG